MLILKKYLFLKKKIIFFYRDKAYTINIHLLIYVSINKNIVKKK